MKTNTSFQVADYFIYLASQQMIDKDFPEGVTPLKLQKLLYFAQCASLALNGKVLFDSKIQAWQYGPVVKEIYHEYKGHERDTLITPSGLYNELDQQSKKVTKGIWDLLGKYSAGELVTISHKHAPWLDNYREGMNDIEIPIKDMQLFYKNAFSFNE